MEFAASKTWAGDAVPGSIDIGRIGASSPQHPGRLEKWSELDALTLEADTTETAEVGAAGSTCTETTRVLENCPSLTEILLLLARVNKEIPDDDRLAEGGFADSRM